VDLAQIRPVVPEILEAQRNKKVAGGSKSRILLACGNNQCLKKIAGKNAKFVQNLRENCAESALKLRAICPSCAQIAQVLRKFG